MTNQSLFTVASVLYHHPDDKFIVNWGNWNNMGNCIGVRFEHFPGYNLVTPDELVVPWLVSLIGTVGARGHHRAILNALNDLVDRGYKSRVRSHATWLAQQISTGTLK
jgi:hypothetical protein